MITLRRNKERSHVEHNRCDVWLSFPPLDAPDSPAGGVESLVAFDEILLSAGAAAAQPAREETEILTYVYRGGLAQEDSAGSSGVVHAGEFWYATARRGLRRKETNASRIDPAHLFRLSFRPSVVGLEGASERKRFAEAERRNVLCVVASPDGRRGSLRILENACVHSSVLDPGHHLIHEFAPGHSAWLHVIEGEATIQDIILTRGDGVGVKEEPALSLTAQESTEILFVDLGPAPGSARGGVAR